MSELPFDIFTLANFIGTVAFAFSGFLVGVHKKLDVMGVFILSMLTANGGGAVRDILLNQTPQVLTNLTGFWVVFAVFILSYIFRLSRFAKVERSHLFVLSDAMGLVAFSVTGALAGISAELSLFGVIVLAFITAAGGGIIRDLMVNEVPSILSSDFYGSVAVVTAFALWALDSIGIASNLNLTLVFVIAVLLRLLAYYKSWKLPRIS